MFFFRVNFTKFKMIVAQICKEREYMRFSDTHVYRLLYYVEKAVVHRIESDVPFQFQKLVRTCFDEFNTT